MSGLQNKKEKKCPVCGQWNSAVWTHCFNCQSAFKKKTEPFDPEDDLNN
jgi:hypothetical protein